MKVVDADAHVEEGPATWECMDPDYYARRPIPVVLEPGLAGYGGFNAVWLVEGQVRPKMAGPGWHIFASPPLSVVAKSKSMSTGAQDMTDVQARLADMDRYGIDYQVVYPSLFLATVAEETGLEREICRAYNRFMSNACAQSKGRIFFAAVVPTQDAGDAVKVAREARELGAVSVMVPGLLWDKPLSEPSFLPFYEELARQDLVLGVHVAWGSPSLNHIFSSPVDGAFGSFVLPVLMGFFSLMASGVFERFPELRCAFLEAGCEWLPYMVNQLDRRFEMGRQPITKRPSQMMKEGNIYLSCEADEDLDSVLKYLPEDRLIMASDYPHADPSTEEDMVRALEERQAQLSARTREKILSDNPIALYKLPI